MKMHLIQFLNTWNVFQVRYEIVGLTTLILLVSSTALGNHLDTHSIFDVTKPHSQRGLRQDPTLQKFWVLPNPSTPSPIETEPPKAIFVPNDSLPSPQAENPPDQAPGIPPLKLGWNFLVNGQTDAALSAYRQALSRHPHSAQALLGMGMTLKTLGKITEAKKVITQSLEIDPQLAAALVHLGYLYADGQLGPPAPDTARHLFHQAQQIGDPFARIALLELQARSSL